MKVSDFLCDYPTENVRDYLCELALVYIGIITLYCVHSLKLFYSVHFRFVIATL